MSIAHARRTDPAESAAAYDRDHAYKILDAVLWLYTLGPASDEQMVFRYETHLWVHKSWPAADRESIRKRCSDARRLDKRIQKVGTTMSSHGKTVGKYGYVEVAA